MAKFIGKRFNIEVYGESHSDKIGIKCEGFPKIKVDEKQLYAFMQRRKPKGDLFTSRKEKDELFFSGLEDGYTTENFRIEIKNGDVKKSDYENLKGKPRPSHADYAWFLKDGVTDFSGGGRFSGRLTAPVCALGGIVKNYLQNMGIEIYSFVASIGNVKGKSYKDGVEKQDIVKATEAGGFALSKANEMQEELARAREQGDSLGGRVECVVYNLHGGVGDNLFEGLEGKLASLIYSIPGVKGVEFGLGFDFCDKNGSHANDGLYYDDGKVKLISNNSGGINGGISNGEPINIGIAFRPTPSIAKEQFTVDLISKENVKIKIDGRHDACICVRALPVVESVVAIALLDELGE